MEKRRRIVNCVNDPSRKIKHQVKVYFDDLAILSRPLVQLSVSSEALKTVTYDRKIKSSCSVRFTPENAK